MDILFIDFLNSNEQNYRTGEWEDHLKEPGWLDKFLAKHNLAVEIPFNAEAMAALVGLRIILRPMVEALVNHQSFSSADLTTLNQILAKDVFSRRLIQTIQGVQLELVPETKDWDWLQGEVVASFVEFLGQNNTERLKICANSTCQWLFYDESKSRTRRFCSCNSCGNLTKVRRFRERHKEAT